MRYGMPTRFAILACFAFGVGAISTSRQLPSPTSIAFSADPWGSDSAQELEDPRLNTSQLRLREGTRIGPLTGSFSSSSRRWIFESEDPADDELGQLASKPTEAPIGSPKQSLPTKFRVLENLALERIVEAISQDSSDIRWVVTGVITEFSSQNWLLLTTIVRAPGSGDAPAAN